MGYYEHLCTLLAPLGVYRLDGGVSGAELLAAGEALDGSAQALAYAERESCLATAQDEGLRRAEEMFSCVGARVSPEQRRAAIASLCAIGADGFTAAAMNAAILGCGIRASVEELGEGRLRVRFPGTAGEPEDFARLKRVLLGILPCHLAVEFYFNCLTWRECEANGTAWADIETAEHSWESFEESFATRDEE